MYVQIERSKEQKSRAVANSVAQKKNNVKQGFGFVDNRPETITQRRQHEMANNSSKVSQLRGFQDMVDNHSAQQQPIQKKENKTGLPDNLKAGMENISGMSLDGVKVHRNSDKPTAVQAHAYTQGNNIHLGPGQEKHLAHELGHVIQQIQGRVQPTSSVNGMAVNDNAGLEKEADVMGAKALQMLPKENSFPKNRQENQVVANSVSQKRSNAKQGGNRSNILQKVSFTYNTNERGAKNMKPTDTLASITGFQRDAGGNRRWEYGKQNSGWASVGSKQNKEEGTKLNHSRKAELIKQNLMDTYKSKTVQEILEMNKFGTKLLNENTYRTKEFPRLDNGKYEKKSKVTDYINEGMQLIIEYPTNLFYWPKTKGDSGLADDYPVEWEDASEVDLTGWTPQKWDLSEIKDRNMWANSIKGRVDAAQDILKKIGG